MGSPWTKALEASAATIDLATHLSSMDDEDKAHLLRLIAIVKAATELSSATPNLHRISMDALRWHAGIETDKSVTGFGSLDTSGDVFTGRPTFSQVTAQNIPVRSRQHRRHIVARWGSGWTSFPPRPSRRDHRPHDLPEELSVLGG